jgi:peptidoglycan/xylan/chitin deacetylase (PgdA/CDA1 family)
MRNLNFSTYLIGLFLLAPQLIGCAQAPLALPNTDNFPSSLQNENVDIYQPNIPEVIDSEESIDIPTPAPSVEPQPQPTTWDVSDVDIAHIDPARKLIAFTFDDAPSRTLEGILTVYAAYNEANPDCRASATIFCNSGRFDEQTPHLLTSCLALGIELGNHTHSHYDLTTLSEAILHDEIDRTDQALQAIDGKERHLLRAPFGKSNDFVAATAPVPMIDWTIDTLDWSGVSEDAIYRTVFDNRFSGAIVLMHDGYQHTVDALKRLLPDLKADGYQVVSVSQLAKAHGCTLYQGSTYIRARKRN